MPLPIPQEYVEDETIDEFIQRCMRDDTMNEEYPDSAQRYAVCLNISAEYSMSVMHENSKSKQKVVDNLKPRYTNTDEQGS
jgi:hypothetical protein